ncbi:hypothetical protein E9549_08340 [Blastococcus sp. MG754426]|uniref:hypothetical protein n=1 Tax=unclassified Blastococcus TaxID=2619396 RepID=UPI001EF127F2|nr:MULTISPECIES: hypothetical protein [unclassified Blastococcus]MCF6507415.1 hypothetical protein [Blastococcus sp. MG754426]MCF6512037.1 hypothetical protein [Blastococcus sp. MG754427]
MTRSGRPLRRRVPVVLLAALLPGAALAGCGEDDEPAAGAVDVDVRPPEDLADPYTGAYTAEFREDLDAYAGLEVSLVGEVGRIVSPVAFTLTGEDVEPILVVTEREMPDLRPGQVVALGAEPTEEFDLAALERELGTDLPDEPYAEWDGDAYLDAATVEVRP